MMAIFIREMCSIQSLASIITFHDSQCSHSALLWFLPRRFCSLTLVWAAWPALCLSDSWMETVEAWAEVEFVVLRHYRLRDDVEVRGMGWHTTAAGERVMLSRRFCWCLSVDLPTFFLRPRKLALQGRSDIEVDSLDKSLWYYCTNIKKLLPLAAREWCENPFYVSLFSVGLSEPHFGQWCHSRQFSLAQLDSALSPHF